jgi:hypothetical protein
MKEKRPKVKQSRGPEKKKTIPGRPDNFHHYFGLKN